MPWRHFFVTVLRRIVTWPSVLLILAFVFRNEIKRLSPAGLRRFKAGPLEVEWEHQIAVAQAHLAVMPAVPSRLMFPGIRDVPLELAPVAADAPASGVQAGFKELDEEVRRVSEGLASERKNLGTLALAKLAYDAEMIDADEVRAIESAAILNYLAGRDPNQIGIDQASDYLALVDKLINRLGYGMYLRLGQGGGP